MSWVALLLAAAVEAWTTTRLVMLRERRRNIHK